MESMNQSVSLETGVPQRTITAFSLWVTVLVIFLLAMSCAKPSDEDEKPVVKPEIPSAEELYARGLENLKLRRVFWLIPYHDYQDAINTFQELVDNYPFNDLAVDAELQIADAYFIQDKYQEAASYYRDFGDLHPDHPKVPYTIFREGLCYFRQVRAPDRDQMTTHQALSVFEKLSSLYPKSEFTQEAAPLIQDLRTRLAESEFLRANFYFDHEEYQAAVRRYESLLHDFSGLGFDEIVLHRLEVSYVKMHRVAEAEQTAERLRNLEQD